MAEPDRYPEALFDKIGGSRFWARAEASDPSVAKDEKHALSMFFAIPPAPPCQNGPLVGPFWHGRSWIGERSHPTLTRSLITQPYTVIIDRHAKQRPDQVAYWDSSRSVTYAQLADRTASIAANLTKGGLRDGDRIAIFLPNGVDWIEACLAALRAGAVVVPISFDAAEGEISYRLTDAACGFVVTTAARKDSIAKIGRDAAITPTVIFVPQRPL